MSPVESVRLQPAMAVFDLTDRYLTELGTRGVHPRPVGTLELALVARLAGGVREAIQPPLLLKLIRNPSGYELWFGQAAPTRRRTWGPRIDRGRYVVRIAGGFYQSAEVEIELPQPTPVSVALEPGPAYPFPRDGAGRTGVKPFSNPKEKKEDRNA